MNFLLVVSAYFPVMCGYSTRLEGIVSNLAKLGHNVTILTPRRDKTMREIEQINSQITVIRYPYHGIISAPYLIWRIHKLLSLKRFDIVSGHSPTKCVLATIIANLCHRLPIIHMMHYSPRSLELPKWSPKYWFWRIVDDFILNHVDRVGVISYTLRDELLKRGLSLNKVMVIPNGVDIRKFTPRRRDKRLEDKYNLKNKNVVMFLGRFQPWENLSSLVDIFLRVKACRNDVVLMLVGDGPDKNVIERIIRKYELQGDVIITGFVPPEEVPRYYSLCDVFVMVRPDIPMLNLTTPIKPVEAMAMEKTIVSTDVGGMREIIEDGKNGFLVSHSEEAISKKILEVLADEKIRQKIGTNARDYVLSNRDWSLITEKFVKSIEGIV